MVWSTDWWLKEANSPSYVSWHQDSQYWGLDSDRLVTVWVALSLSNVASGCMRYLPGSHLGPDLPHRETYHDDNLLTRGQEITKGIDESRAVNVELEPGEGSIFAFRIAHASHSNRTGDRRIGLAVRFIPPDARQVRSDHDSAALVRGVDTHGHFELEPEPERDFDPTAMEFHRWAEEERRKILYRLAHAPDLSLRRLRDGARRRTRRTFIREDPPRPVPAAPPAPSVRPEAGSPRCIIRIARGDCDELERPDSVDDDQEEEGLDLALHDERGYIL